MSDSGLLSKIVLHHEISALLFREARILDEERYTEWLEFFTEDVHYWVPGVENLARRDLERSTSVDHMAHFDDTMDDLRMRVERFVAPTAWAEDPPTRHLHLISNIEVFETEEPDVHRVHSAFVNYRSQGESENATLYGRREDLIKQVSEREFKISKRVVVLRHNVLPAKN